uniref:Uncharacterized protein n=1 Tax=Tetranychus urticae TaxID=32264 RepID=T1KBZ5_TETUR
MDLSTHLDLAHYDFTRKTIFHLVIIFFCIKYSLGKSRQHGNSHLGTKGINLNLRLLTYQQNI